MTLRAKIILLFVGLAIVPLVVVAAFGSRQAEDLTARLVAGILSEPAWEVAGELEASVKRLDARLASLAGEQATREVAEGTRSTDEWLAAADPLRGTLTHLELTSEDRATLAEWGRPPPEARRCFDGRWSRYLRLRHPVTAAGEGVTLVAGFWLDALPVPSLAGASGRSTQVLHRQTGQVLLAPTCAATEAPAATGLGRPPLPLDGGGLYVDQQGRERFGGLAPVAGRPWVVMASVSGATILGPVRQIQESLWLLILLLTVATGLAFSVLLGNVVRSLEQLTDAASSIGDGELNPWLPPPGNDEVGRLSLAFGQMLDRLRRMIQHVDQEGRLAVVGRLTAYLAHEIRNPLSSIRLNLQSLSREARQGRLPDGTSELVDVSLKEVDRLADAVNRVLQLGGGTPVGEPQEVGLHGVVQEAASLLAGQGREAGVEIRLSLDAAADRVLAQPGPLKGVFVNLLMNAIEAQPDGGEILVRSRLTSLSGGGPGVAIHVRDRGHGVPPALRERIFEPFFTTRSQGSGIGLATSQRTVRDFGGDLYLADLAETSRGTEFVVELPLAALAPERVPAPRVHLPMWMRTGLQRGLAARALSGSETQESSQ